MIFLEARNIFSLQRLLQFTSSMAERVFALHFAPSPDVDRVPAIEAFGETLKAV